MQQQHRRSDRIALARKERARNSSLSERDEVEEHPGRRSSPPKNRQQRKRKSNTRKRSEPKPKRREGHANNSPPSTVEDDTEQNDSESGQDMRKEHVPRRAFQRAKEPERSHPS